MEIEGKKVSGCPYHIFMAYCKSNHESIQQYMMYAALFLSVHLPFLFGKADQFKTGTGGCPATPAMMYGLTIAVMVAFALFF